VIPADAGERAQRFARRVVVRDIAQVVEAIHRLAQLRRGLLDLLAQLRRLALDAIDFIQRFQGLGQILLDQFVLRSQFFCLFSVLS
jgi:hypothetical protein